MNGITGGTQERPRRIEGTGAIGAVLTDIEGTTTPVAFVYETLFPYARQGMAGFIAAHAGEPGVREQLEAVSREAGKPLTDAEAVRQLMEWMDQDRKITPLKALQGLIWERGYLDGSLKGVVYPDVPPRLAEWRGRGIRLYVYSSGSVRAQQLIFRYSDQGDLTPLFSGYFDTGTGGKREPASYRQIAREIGLPAAEVVFLSDVTGELEAAKAAGMRTVLLDREGDKDAAGFDVAADFNEVRP